MKHSFIEAAARPPAALGRRATRANSATVLPGARPRRRRRRSAAVEANGLVKADVTVCTGVGLCQRGASLARRPGEIEPVALKFFAGQWGSGEAEDELITGGQ